MRQLLDEAGISNALDRIADEIVARHDPAKALAIIGIKARGETLARRIIHRLADRGFSSVEHGALDIAMYRDDPHGKGAKVAVRSTEVNFDVSDVDVVLVDDVIHTGRTIRAALDALMDLGRPAAVRLAVLIDRGGRELPIEPNHVGLKVDSKQKVRLTLSDSGRTEEVVLR